MDKLKAAEEYGARMLKDNPGGFTVASYVNSEVLPDAFEAGWDACEKHIRSNDFPTYEIYLHMKAELTEHEVTRTSLEMQIEILREARESALARASKLESENAALKERLKMYERSEF